MLNKIKKKLTQTFVGETIKEWGIIFEQDRSLMNEQMKLGLYQKDKQLILILTVTFRNKISYNVRAIVIPIYDLHYFISTLKSRYNELCGVTFNRHTAELHASDKLPLSQRWSIKLIQGIKASKLLMDYKNPSTKETEYRFYGYITKKSDKKVLVQSDSDISKGEGLVIAGDGFNAALDILAEFALEQEKK